MKKMIFADNAATTAIDEEALQKMMLWLKDEYGNASQPYSFGSKAKKAINESRQIIASCIGANSEEIFFTSCGTESDNWVIKNFANKTIITTNIEHHAILNSCKSISSGTKILYLQADEKGLVNSCELDKTLSLLPNNHGPVLVSIMTANNEIGTIQPIKELAEIAHAHGALFHTDAVQAIGHIHMDVNEMNIDLLSASAHKFNGPKGIGFLFVKKGLSLLPLLDGGSQECGMRAGTENVASIVGMAIALKKNTDNIERNQNKLLDLEHRLIHSLHSAGLDFIRNGHDYHIPGNISLSFKNRDGEMILHRMDLKGICISTGSACDSINTQISHVIKAIGLDSQYAQGTIRISLGKNNTTEEVDTIATELIRLLQS